MGDSFDAWWAENGQQYSADACHMSEYHMASVVWLASRQALEMEAKQGEACEPALRDRFAIAALPLMSTFSEDRHKAIAAYEMADLMLEVRRG